ncbi:MAG: YdeI/OmpD-associated family protein [Agriterribacter sp.]
MKKKLVDNFFKIKKQPTKGGWHYVVISDISITERLNLGLVRVSGTVDKYAIKQFNLLPMKNGSMLLPLKAALRKAIQKKEGDTVHVILFRDKSPVTVPDYIIDSLIDFPGAYNFFMSLSESNKKYYIDWIEESKTMETKTNRLVKTIEQLEKGIKFYDWPAKND